MCPSGRDRGHRFHALTERARYTIGGQHEIEFVYSVRHAETGAILSGRRRRST
jgi:hypothetical protein